MTRAEGTKRVSAVGFRFAFSGACSLNFLQACINGSTLSVVIVGAGLGGLCCAIACARTDLPVVVLEKNAQLTELGAGISLPPNAIRVLDQFGLMPAMRAAGAVTAERYRVFDYHTGDILATRPGMDKNGRKWMEEAFGHCQQVDYQRVLVTEAQRLGVDIRLEAEVREISCYESDPFVQLANGEKISGDVIVGADGIMSRIRTEILGYVKQPQPTGDLAYRATIPRTQVEKLLGSFPQLAGVLHANEQWTWWGPNSHVMFYPIKNGQIFNMVLLCPDDLPENVRRADADIDQMRGLFKDWDPL
ncbi:MAG: hypothetical protein Q9165_005165 [Trypethelium subeluteriae]